MRREFRPWFAVVNEGYDQGTSGGGYIPGPGEDTLCGDDDITYFLFSDAAEAAENGCDFYEKPGWYKCYESGEYDPSYYSATPPTDAHSCNF